MSNEINNFISELKKTRDYSGFAPKGHEGKTNKKVEKIESVENTRAHHSDSHLQEAQTVQEEPRIVTATIQENSTYGQVNIERLSEPLIETIKHIQPNRKKETIKTVSNGLDKVYHPFKLSDAFINTVNEAYAQNSYSLALNKRFDVDDQVHEILMQLKHQGQIKSVSTLINVILSDFIKNNKEALQTLFAASSNRINF
jgi:rubrerythrin